MKVIQSVETLYQEQYLINERLKIHVDEILLRIKKDTWHYFSRIKGKESYALKLETGRIKDAKKLEDFFACTLVVENLNQIDIAVNVLKAEFEILYQRPQDTSITHKNSSSFEFDDLRLYVKIKRVEFMPPKPIENVIFEIQIKTFLQHAWSLATHDLIYKSEEINWSKERIAFQIKAMLEQAELVISGVNKLVDLPEVLKDNKLTVRQKEMLAFFIDFFKREDLPTDVIRLCNSTMDLLSALKIDAVELTDIFNKENSLGRGVNYKNLSPYLLVLQSIINQKQSKVEEFLKKDNRFKILLPKEIQTNSINFVRNTVKI